MTDVLRDLDQWDRDIEIWTLETEYGIATDGERIVKCDCGQEFETIARCR